MNIYIYFMRYKMYRFYVHCLATKALKLQFNPECLRKISYNIQF